MVRKLQIGRRPCTQLPGTLTRSASSSRGYTHVDFLRILWVAYFDFKINCQFQTVFLENFISEKHFRFRLETQERTQVNPWN